jgi:hypothetical protein
MASRGIDEVLMPGQVLALQKRIEILAPQREQSIKQLEAAKNEAAALARSGNDTAGADRALKRAARLRTEVAAVTGEIETLESLVAARLARSPQGRG